MREREELAIVPFEELDEVELEQADGSPVDINDPELEAEEIEIDPKGDAFASFATLRVKMDPRGSLASSIAII